MLYTSLFPGAVPLVVTVTVVVDVCNAMGIFPTTMLDRADDPVQAGAAAHVPLKVTTQPDAGEPPDPIVTRITLSLPTIAGDVPQLLVQVGGVG
jgi:hypothetical protein